MFRKIFPKVEEFGNLNEDEYLEISSNEEKKKIKIRIATLNEFGDVEGVQNLLREGDIVWVKIKPLKDKDMTDLRRAIERLKRTVQAIHGDIAGVDQDWIVACPGFAHIHR